MIIMGLDISSTTIGISFLEQNDKTKKIKLLSVETYKPPESKESKDFYNSLLQTKSEIIKIIKKNKPDVIVIENISEHFQGGASTSKTIIKLAIYNRTICLAIFETFGIEPVLLNVNTVRSIIRPKDHKGRLLKEEVPEAVEKMLDIKFPYEYNKKGKIDSSSYDKADSIAVALAFILKEEEK